MKRAIGFEAGVDAGVVTGVIAALYGVVVSAVKKADRVEKKGASNDSPFFIVAVKSLAQTCRVIRNSLNV